MRKLEKKIGNNPKMSKLILKQSTPVDLNFENLPEPVNSSDLLSFQLNSGK